MCSSTLSRTMPNNPKRIKKQRLCHKNPSNGWRNPFWVNCKQISFTINELNGQMMQNVNGISADSHSYWKVCRSLLCVFDHALLRSPEMNTGIRLFMSALLVFRCNEKHTHQMFFALLWCALFKIQSCCEKWINRTVQKKVNEKMDHPLIRLLKEEIRAEIETLERFTSPHSLETLSLAFSW